MDSKPKIEVKIGISIHWGNPYRNSHYKYIDIKITNNTYEEVSIDMINLVVNNKRYPLDKIQLGITNDNIYANSSIFFKMCDMYSKLLSLRFEEQYFCLEVTIIPLILSLKLLSSELLSENELLELSKGEGFKSEPPINISNKQI